MDSLKANISVGIQAVIGKDTDLGPLSDKIDFAAQLGFIFGDGAVGKADLIWHDRNEIAAGGNDVIDLAGSLKDAFGDTLNFAIIRAIMIVNQSHLIWDTHTVATDATITIGNATNRLMFFTSATDTLTLHPTDIFVVTRNTATGFAVTPGSVDEIKILNNDGADKALYDILLIGEST